MAQSFPAWERRHTHARAPAHARDTTIQMAEEDFAAFQAEIAELKADDGAGEAEEPEEKSFVDDDGTTYVWDAITRKFKPEGEDVAAAPVVPPPVQWSEADMVFVDDDDAAPMPSLKEAKKAVALARDADGDGDGDGDGGDGGGFFDRGSGVARRR